MSHPIRLSDQLKQHLRALRRSHGLTQAQLGERVGVKQARIAEIEADPGAVGLDQLTRILAALGGTFHLHTAGTPGLTQTQIALPTPTARQRAPAQSPKKLPARKSAAASPTRGQGAAPPVARRRVATAAKSAPRTNVVIRAKKGAW